ncbi:pentapeptide repeat-containing protein [Glutamicibacter sp.]|uniref:pentapeptide repeat-containing protein n=1 Tax=Glutamicibacter sp. TaxID=1931995 RepID=UPI0028BED8C5|nr:pentapeptide repeat-containing protein [Glutamicibacter sp.]
MPAPKIRNFVLPPLAEGFIGDLAGAGYIDALSFSGINDDFAADAARFEECSFNSLNAPTLSLRNARLIQCELTQVSAPVFQGAGVHLNDVRMSHSRFGSADAADSTWDSVVVENCKFGWLNLRGAKLRDVEFRNCQFDELDLGESLRVRFTDCRTAVLAANQAKMNSVFLQGLDFATVDGITGLRGASISSLQLSGLAEQLASHAGLKITY